MLFVGFCCCFSAVGGDLSLMFFFVDIRNAATYGKLHRLCGSDMFDGLYPVTGYHIYVAGYRISHGDIYRYVFMEPEILHFLPGNKTETPHVVIVHICQYMLGELFIVTRKRFEEIPGDGVDVFDAGCLFQQFVEEVDNTGGDEKGAEIPDDDEYNDDQQKPDAVILNPYYSLRVGIGEDGDQVVDGGNRPEDRIRGDCHGCQHQEPLKEILEYFFIPETSIHNGSF